MALILEIRDRQGAVSWHRLSAPSLTIGRALSNDVILDDLSVDARHVIIATDESGALTIADLQTANGIMVGGVRAAQPVAVQAGTQVQLGRTTLRFHDVDEPVPPAIVLAAQSAPVAERPRLTGRVAPALFVASIVLSMVVGWLNSTDRSAGTDVMGAGIASAAFLALWAGIWGASTRGADRRYRFGEHLGIISSAFLALFLTTVGEQWMSFFLPGVSAIGVLGSIVFLSAVTLVVVAHLAVAGALTQRGRWIAGLSVSGILLALVLFGNDIGSDKFSDVPKYYGQLKPADDRMVPSMSVEDFVKTMGESRTAADKAVAR